MLGKLIKHEWKSVYKIGCVMLIAVLSVTLIGCLYFSTPMWRELFIGTSEVDDFAAAIAGLIGMGSLLVSVVMVTGAMYGMMIYLGVRFFRSMYTDEGYLAHTLPVTPHQLLGSKLIVGGIWVLIVNVASILSILVMIFSMIASIMEGAMPEMNVWNAMQKLLDEFVVMYETELGMDMVHYAVTMILTVIIGAFSGIMTIYGALTIGQLSRKHKAMMGILTFFGFGLVYMIIGMVVSMVSMASAITQGTNGEVSMNAPYDGSLIISIITGVALYFLSCFIIKKKLNLD